MILRQIWLSWRRRVWSWKRNSAAVRKVLYSYRSSSATKSPPYLPFPCLDAHTKLKSETSFAILKINTHLLGRRRQCNGRFCSLAVNNLDFDILLYLCKLLNPTAASGRASLVQSCILVASHGTHTFTSHQLELDVCVCVRGGYTCHFYYCFCSQMR